MSTIDEVKQRTDIVEVISQYVSLTKAGRNFRALCPFHSEKNPSFYVYPGRQSWHCFGACSTGGDVFSFIMKKQGIDFGEALHLLAEKAGVTIISSFEQQAGKDELERLYQVNATTAQYFHELLLNSTVAKRARDYLARRDLLAKTISDFQLGFSPNSRQALTKHLKERGYTEAELLAAGLVVESETGERHDRFRNKLMFPIFDMRGRVTGFGARVLDDSLPKYINSPQTPLFDKSSRLYGINLAAATVRHQNMAVIVEGYMDVLTAHQYGFNNVVASMGTSITEKQVSTLKRLSRNMALALDADAAGEEATLKAVGYENTLDAEVKVIIMPKGKDPDAAIKEDAQSWQRLLSEAVPIIDYTFNLVTSELDLTTARDKSLARDKLLPIIYNIKDIVRRAHYLQKLARLINVGERNLEADLARFTSNQARYKIKEQKPQLTNRTPQPLLSSPIEEECLAWLVQYPGLKTRCQGLLPEYFENSENREIFLTWQKVNDPIVLKEKLDIALQEYLESLVAKNLPPASQSKREDVVDDCILRLKEKFLRSQAAKRAERLALKAEPSGVAVDSAKLQEQEQAVEEGRQLGEVFAQRSRRR